VLDRKFTTEEELVLKSLAAGLKAREIEDMLLRMPQSRSTSSRRSASSVSARNANCCSMSAHATPSETRPTCRTQMSPGDKDSSKSPHIASSATRD